MVAIKRLTDPGIDAKTKSKFVKFYLAGVFIAYLLISIGTPICFADGTEYITLMDKNVFSRAYWEEMQLMYRSWLVPVVFSVFGNADFIAGMKIVIFQTLVQFYAWMFLLQQVKRLIKINSLLFEILAPTVVFLGGYQQWNKYLLSDSLGLSVVLIFVAMSIRVLRKLDYPDRQSLVYLIKLVAPILLLGWMSMSARDTNAFVFMGSVLHLVVVVLGRQSKAFRLSVLVIALAIIGLHFSNASKRSLVAMEHHLVGTVLPTENIRLYFLKHGMPSEISKIGESFELQPPRTVDISKMFIYMDEYRRTDPERRFASNMAPIWYQYLLLHPQHVIMNSAKNLDLIYGQFWGKGALGGMSNSGRERIHSRPGEFVPIIAERPFKISFVDYFSWQLKLLLVLVAIPAGLYFQKKGNLGEGYLATIAILGFVVSCVGFLGEHWELGEMIRHSSIGFMLSCMALKILILIYLIKAHRYVVGLKGV